MKISCDQVEFSYSNQKLIQNLNLIVNEGEHIWIRGQSGSGKSSLLKLMAGLLMPQAGCVQLDSWALQNLSENEIRNIRLKNIGYVHQENHLVDHWTVKQNLDLIQGQSQQQESYLKKFNFNVNIQKKLVSELSGGEKQRISLIRLILQNPKLALLDEPTSHLDDINTQRTLEILKSEFVNSTMVIVSHDSRLEKFNFEPIEMNQINK